MLFIGILFSSLCSAGLFEENASDNFVIRWAFQAICDHSFDPRKPGQNGHGQMWPTPTTTGSYATFDPATVKPGDLVFVRDAPLFFKKMHPQIQVPYCILTHGECLDMFKESYFKYLNDGKVLAWFTIHHSAINHEKVHPIPLGIVQYLEMYEKRGEMNKLFMKLRKNKKEKLLYMNFKDWHNPERTRIRKLFLDKPFCDVNDNCRFNQYIKETAEHKFQLSPPGLGPDCYRVWESLLVGTIPIVEHSYFDWMYEGLPVLFIDKWEEVTPEFLEQKYREFHSRKWNIEKLYMEYWLAQIQSVRERVMLSLKT